MLGKLVYGRQLRNVKELGNRIEKAAVIDIKWGSADQLVRIFGHVSFRIARNFEEKGTKTF